MEYHLSIGGGRSGPHTQFFIIDGIRDGRFTGEELVWRVGFEKWLPLKDAEDFSGYWSRSPEVLEKAEAARQLARTELDRPQPWLRFWARVLDYTWFTLGVSMVASIILPMSAVAGIQRLAMMHVPVDALALLLYVPVEAWMLSRWGTTPGRSLLRIRVRRLDNGLPEFRQALHRSFQVFLKGMGLGLPFLSLVAMAWWRLRLLQKGVASWDEVNETRVEHGEPEVWRFLVLAGILMGLVLLVAVALSMSAEVMEAMSRLPK